MECKHLFTPLNIGPMEVKNRFVVPPMGNNFANTDGTWSDQSLAYYQARAEGGFGLITIEATVVHEGSKGGPRKPCLFSDASIPSLSRIAQACHQYGAKVSVQLQNAGPEGNARFAGAPLLAASPIPAAFGRDVPQEVSTEAIYELAKGYGQAARRAMQAGVDAVEIHMAHGYLVSSFLSPRTNKRVDEFGGSFENRLRFPKLIIEEIQKATEGKLAILARLNASDEMPGGLDVHDNAAIARALQEYGVQGIHLSRAVHLKDEFMWAPTAVHGGFNADLVTEVKKAISIPIITVGRFTDPYYAELLVEEGRADLVAFGRQSLADPALPNKVLEQRTEDIIPCIACLQGCVANMYQGKPLRCLANPCLGFESQPVTPAENPRHIVVIGGGPAGIVAAYTAAERGHQVDLYEANSTLGGNMLLASYPPGKGDIANMIRSYIVRCEKAGVNVHSNTEISAENINLMKKSNQADAVIVTTGAKPLILPIEGINNPDLLLAGDVLAGKTSVGLRVLVVGGGMVGCETADFLAELGHKVSVVEYRDSLGADMIAEHRKEILKDFDEYHVEQITNAKVTKFFADGIEYVPADVENTVTPQTMCGFDSVVLALGYAKHDPLSEELKALGIETYVVGDACEARRTLNATAEAFEIARSL